MKLHTLELKSYSNKEIKISGYASVFGQADYHNDIISSGAFADSIVRHYQGFTIKLLWQHDHAKPIGVINNLKEDHKGLLVEASINKDVSQADEIVSLIRQGAIDSFSIGFNIEKSKMNEAGQREILKADLWEVSLVTFPANRDSKIYQIHSRPESWESVSQLLSTKSKTIFKL